MSFRSSVLLLLININSLHSSAHSENRIKNSDFDVPNYQYWDTTSTDPYSYAAAGIYNGWPHLPSETPLVESGYLGLVAGADSSRQYSSVIAFQCVETTAHAVEASLEILPRQTPTPIAVDLTSYPTSDCSGIAQASYPVLPKGQTIGGQWNTYSAYNVLFPQNSASIKISVFIYANGPNAPMPFYDVDHVFLGDAEQIFIESFDAAP